MAWRSWVTVLLMLGAAFLCGETVWAQEPPMQQEPIHTLHVYMDLIQVPVLVLDSEMQRMKPVDPGRFLVSLDSGPAFHPKHVRQEGDDPITLAILLDPNAEPDLMKQMSAALPKLAPESLHARDHVTIYVLDCGMFRTLSDAPADPAVLKAGVDRALQPWFARRREKHAQPCEKRFPLYDALAYAVKHLGESPGRRVLFAVTNGANQGSRSDWNMLRSYAQREGVAVFGYMTRDSVPASIANGRFRMGNPSIGRGVDPSEDPFNMICQMSGGMVIPADEQYVAKQLTRFTTTVRERYILEFSRARNEAPGEHSINVTLQKSYNNYIRPAGVSILMQDPDVAKDPNTIPRDATDAPELGSRRGMGAPR